MNMLNRSHRGLAVAGAGSVLAVLLLGAPLAAQPIVDIPYQKFVLSNGLTLIASRTG